MKDAAMAARFALLVSVFFLSVAVGRSQEKEKDVCGTLQSIDVDKGTITVTLPPYNKPQTYNFSRREIPIHHPLGQALKFEDLRPKSRLNLRLNTIEDVVSMRDDSDYEWGTVLAVDPDKKEFLARCGHAFKTLKIDDIPFRFNDEKGAIKNLKPMQGIKLILAPDRQKVVEIRAGKGVASGNPYCRFINQSGYLLKKDDARKIIQIGSLGDRTRILEFTYDAWTGVRLVVTAHVLRTISMDVVNPPGKVILHFESDRQRISALDVDVPIINRCVVKSYDKEKRALTILTDQEGNAETIPIAADVTMVKDGVRVEPFKEIMEKRLVTLGLSLDQKEILFVNLLAK